MATMFDLPVTPTSESIHTSIIVLLDPEIVGVAVGILLLSSIQAEIYDIENVLQVNGGFVWFTNQPDVGRSESIHTSPAALLDPEN